MAARTTAITLAPRGKPVVAPHPRVGQSEAYKALRPYQYRVIQMPTGAGKTRLMQMLATMDAQEGYKTIISVPMRDIGYDIATIPVIVEGKQALYHLPVQNNTTRGGRGSTTDRLLAFLESGSDHFVCTHRTLINAFNYLKETNNLDALQHISIFIDEAHHLATGEDETNRIGEVVKYIVDNDLGRVTATTATLFRSDRLPIIATEHETLFESYILPLDQHLMTLQYLTGVKINVHLQSGTFKKTIRSIFKKGVGKHIVYVPHSSHGYHEGAGRPAAEQMVQDIRDVLPKRVRMTDLVSTDGRTQRLNRLKDNKLDEDQFDDVIVSMNLGKEGSDFPLLNKMTIVGNRGSLLDVIQMVGRLLRDHPSKENTDLEVNFILQADLMGENPVEDINTYFNAIAMTMMMEDVMAPRLTRSGRRLPGRTETIDDLIGNADTSVRVRADVYAALVVADPEDDDLDAIVRRVLEDHGVEADDRIVRRFVRGFRAQVTRAARAVRLANDVDVPKPELDLIERMTVAEQVHMIEGKTIGKKVFEQLRKALSQSGLAAAMEKTKQCIEHIERTGTTPSKQHPIGLWLIRQRIAKGKAASTSHDSYHTNKWYPEIEKYSASRGHPDLFANRHALLLQQGIDRIEEAALHIKNTGHFPSSKDKDTNIAALGAWIAMTRRVVLGKACGTWFDEWEMHARKLGQPDLFQQKVHGEALHNKNTSQVCVYIDEHGKIPAQTTRLGRWLASQRRAHAKNADSIFPSSIVLAKEQGHPTLFSIPSQYTGVLLEKIISMHEFWVENQRLPSRNSNLMGTPEYNLGVSITRLRKAAKTNKQQANRELAREIVLKIGGKKFEQALFKEAV